MPSPVSGRRIGEWALRVLSFAILVVIVMRAWDQTTRRATGESVTQGSIAQSLPRWTMAGGTRIHLALDSVLGADQRDWLAAIERAGTTVTWSSGRIAPIALTLTRVADPAGIVELAASAPPRSTVLVRDRLGVIDSVATESDGIRIEIPGARTRGGVSADGATAWAVSPDSIVYKRLLVEGAASWETKFTIAALIERGWKVDALTHVAPGVDVRVGNPATPDTSRYAAAIAVDSTASLIARAASRFVRSGGGLVTLHDASSIGPRGVTSITLEQRPGGEVRAYRVDGGRVIRVGYADLWRERMHDDTIVDPAAAHRAWLARVVASVAFAPRVAMKVDSTADPAPLADMVDRIGPRSNAAGGMSTPRSEVPSSVLFGVLLASLLLELASRRLRGAK